MKEKLSWHVKRTIDSSFIVTKDFFAGTFHESRPLNVSILLWNNRYGTEDAKNLTNFSIGFFFKDMEDNVLLPYISVTINERMEIPLTIVSGRGVLIFPTPITLSGAKNNGSRDDYPENVLSLTLKLTLPSDMRLKDNDLKSLCLEILDS